MTRARRETVADWLIVIGAAALLGSLFLTWSHQFSPAFLAAWGTSEQLRNVPHDPTAWQVYSIADVVLAVFAVGLVAVALRGNRAARLCAIAGCGLAVAFIVHALAHAPTNGANIFNPSLSVPDYAPNSPTSGVGEIACPRGHRRGRGRTGAVVHRGLEGDSGCAVGRRRARRRGAAASGHNLDRSAPPGGRSRLSLVGRPNRAFPPAGAVFSRLLTPSLSQPKQH